MFNFWQNLSIKKKLVLAMAVALILSSGLLAFLNNLLTSNVLKSRLDKNEMPYVMSSIRLNIEKEISLAINASMQIAENQFIIDWLTAGEPESDAPKIKAFLNRLNKANKAGETFVGSWQTKHYFTQNGLIKTLSPSEPLDDWYFKFFKDQLRYDTGIGPNKKTGELTLFINYLIKPDNVVLGVSGMGVGMQKLVDFVNNFVIGETGRVFVVASDGTIKIAKNLTLEGQNNIDSLPGYGDLKPILLSKKSFLMTEISEDGQDYFIASDYIAALDWYVIAQIPQSEVYGALNMVFRNSAIVTILVIMIFLLLGIWVAKGISAPIENISRMLKQIAEGDADLRQRLPAESNDELGALARNFNAFIGQLQNLIQQVQNSCQSLLVSVEQVNDLSKQTSSELVVQKDKTIEVASAVTEMGATIEDIARNACDTAEAAGLVANKVAEGSGVVSDTIRYIEVLAGDMQVSGEVINKLAEHTVAIGSILSVIRGISEQTNLLALNAAIEAARAGEQGRGFAVVADEVRSLAMRTQQSTAEIQSMITKLQEGSKNAVLTIEAGQTQTEKSVTASTKAGAALQAIDQSVDTIQAMSIQMATATEEQSMVVNDINKNIIAISNVTLSTSQAAEKSSTACEQLRKLTDELDHMVSRFKI